MNEMNWQEIIAIVAPIMGRLAWFYNRIDKKFECIDKRFDGVNLELKEIRRDIQSLDTRVSRIEGHLITHR